MDHQINPRLNYARYPYQQITNREIEQLGLPWFMRDDLPSVMSQGSYVYNLDGKNGDGTHWTCFCLKSPNIYYVDPFGTDQPKGKPPTELRTWGKQHGYQMIVANEECFQHLESWLCGHYSCYFAIKMNKYFQQLTPRNFDRIVQKGITKYPSDQNVQLITQWAKKKGIL